MKVIGTEVVELAFFAIGDWQDFFLPWQSIVGSCCRLLAVTVTRVVVVRCVWREA